MQHNCTSMKVLYKNKIAYKNLKYRLYTNLGDDPGSGSLALKNKEVRICLTILLK